MEGNGANGVRNFLGDGMVLRGCRLVRNGRHGYADAPSEGRPPSSDTRFEDCEIVGNTEWGVLARGPGHVMVGGRVRDNGSGQGRAGVREIERAASGPGVRIEGTRFDAGDAER